MAILVDMEDMATRVNWSAWIWPAIIILSSIAISLAAFGDIHSSLRPLIAFWFLAVCPGMAFVRLLRLSDAAMEWSLAIALSLALDVIVASAFLYAHAWSPNRILALLIGASLLGAGLQVVLARDTTIPRGADDRNCE